MGCVHRTHLVGMRLQGTPIPSPHSIQRINSGQGSGMGGNRFFSGDGDDVEGGTTVATSSWREKSVDGKLLSVQLRAQGDDALAHSDVLDAFQRLEYSSRRPCCCQCFHAMTSLCSRHHGPGSSHSGMNNRNKGFPECPCPLNTRERHSRSHLLRPSPLDYFISFFQNVRMSWNRILP